MSTYRVTQFFEAFCAQGARDDRPLVDGDAIAAELGLNEEELLPILATVQRHGLMEDFRRVEGGRMMRITAHGLAMARWQPAETATARTERGT